MVYVGTRLQVIDNSGAKEIECIKVLGRSSSKVAYAGTLIIGSVKKSLPNKKVKKGDVVRAVVAATKKSRERKNGVSVSFGANTAVIINNKNIPVGSRILGPVMLELRDVGLMKVVSMATVAV